MGGIIEWLAEELRRILTNLLDAILDGIVALLSLIPVPQAFTDASTLMQSLPNDLMYFIYLFQVPYGLTLVTGAYAARFAIRRIR